MMFLVLESVISRYYQIPGHIFVFKILTYRLKLVYKSTIYEDSFTIVYEAYSITLYLRTINHLRRQLIIYGDSLIFHFVVVP